jgi:RimJ/RimL family protein N-acetyltransferase
MLRGSRVLLRPVEKRDITIYYDIWSNEDVRRLDGSFTLPPSKEYIIENFNRLLNLEKKYLSIINEKGVLVGYITFEGARDCCNVYSLGITIGRNYWSRGYGEESIRTLLKYLFMNKGAERVELEVLEFNERAIKCYTKCGFVQEGVKRNRIFSDGRYVNLIIMGILKEEYVFAIST